MPVYSATWLALAIVLTALGLLYTWVAFRRRGLPGLLRGLAWTLLPVAAYLTRTLRLIGTIVDQTVAWAAGFVFRPSTWLGIGLAVLAVALFAVSARLRPRGRSRSRETAVPASATRPATHRDVPAAGRDEPLVDDDIDAILRKHGIS